jgi:hypothetical protein
LLAAKLGASRASAAGGEARGFSCLRSVGSLFSPGVG